MTREEHAELTLQIIEGLEAQVMFMKAAYKCGDKKRALQYCQQAEVCSSTLTNTISREYRK